MKMCIRDRQYTIKTKEKEIDINKGNSNSESWEECTHYTKRKELEKFLFLEVKSCKWLLITTNNITQRPGEVSYCTY